MKTNNPISEWTTSAFVQCKRKSFLSLRGENASSNEKYRRFVSDQKSKCLEKLKSEVATKYKVERFDTGVTLHENTAYLSVHFELENLTGVADALIPKENNHDRHHERRRLHGSAR